MIGCRLLQGFASGSALPLGTALLFSAFPAEERGLAFVVFGILLVAAPALGPVLGGALVEYASWREIFFVNVPIGLLGVGIGWRLLRESASDVRVPIDYVGAVLACLAFGGLLYGLANGATSGAAGGDNPGQFAAPTSAASGWTSGRVLFSLGAGGAALVLFILWELRQQETALLDVRLFARPTFAIANLIGWISVIGLFGAEFLLPLYLQVLRGA